MAADARQRPVRSRRDQIIDVAAGLFADRGFHGVSINDIGAATGTSGAALYKHFDSKGALLSAMLSGISDRLLSEGTRRVEDARVAGAHAVLDALVTWHVEFAVTHPALITVHVRDLANLPPGDQQQVRRLQRSYVELWVEAMTSCIDTDAARARSAAHAVFGLVNSTPHSARLAPQQMRELLRSMAHAALRASAA